MPDGDSAAEPPVPIPNTEVKCRHVDGSAVLSRVRVDNCQALQFAAIAQLVERTLGKGEVDSPIPSSSTINKLECSCSAAIAQLVERTLGKGEVDSPIPSSSTTLKPTSLSFLPVQYISIILGRS